MAEVEQDVTRIWEYSRREAEGDNVLRRLRLPIKPVTTGGRILHILYYVFLLAIIWIVVVMTIGLSDPSETTEGRVAGIIGTITIASFFAGIAWIIRRLAYRVHMRARPGLGSEVLASGSVSA